MSSFTLRPNSRPSRTSPQRRQDRTPKLIARILARYAHYEPGMVPIDWFSAAVLPARDN